MAFDAYRKWLGIPAAEQPPNHYRLLAINLFEDDADVIESAADQRMAHVRTFQASEHSALSQRILNELSAAKLCLLNPSMKAAYDAALRHSLVPAPRPSDIEASSGNSVADDEVLEQLSRAVATSDSTSPMPRLDAKRRSKATGWLAVGTVATVFVLALLIFSGVRSKDGRKEAEHVAEHAKKGPHISDSLDFLHVPELTKNPDEGKQPKDESDIASRIDTDQLAGTSEPSGGSANSGAPAPPPVIAMPAMPEARPLDSNATKEQPMSVDAVAAVVSNASQRLRVLDIADKTVYAGEDEVVPVRIERLGYNGPVELRLEGLPAEIQFQGAIVPPGQPRALLGFNLPVSSKAKNADLRVIASFESSTAEKTFHITVRKRPQPQPLVVPLEGLGPQKSMKPITFGPDWLGFNNNPLSPELWQAPGVFARLQTRAALSFPAIPISNYVLELEIELLRADAGLRICLGDPWSAVQLSMYRNKDRGKIEAILPCWRYGGWGWSGHRDVEVNERLPLKWIVLDERHVLCLKNRPILIEDKAWPADLTLRIWCETPGSAVIHRCSCRALLEEDVQLADRPMPRASLSLDPAAAKTRLDGLRQQLPNRPIAGKGYLVNRTRTPMAWLSPGEYVRASIGPKALDKHRVKITQGFWMGRLEVMQEEWNALMPKNPSRVQGSPYLPVDWVTWQDAMLFCTKLNQVESKARRIPKGYGYRLPTDAEWEYACRAGSQEDFSVQPMDIWSREQSHGYPHEVGQKPPNAWGLFDMHGNAMEWCLDGWYDYPKDSSAVLVDPYKLGRIDQDPFVVRGGAWWTVGDFCRSAWRERNHSSPPAGYRGFRIVLGPFLSPTMN